MLTIALQTFCVIEIPDQDALESSTCLEAVVNIPRKTLTNISITHRTVFECEGCTDNEGFI